MKITLDLPEIEGYEYTGEYRAPRNTEYHLSDSGMAFCNDNFVGNVKYLILKKKAPKYKTTTVDTGRELFKYVEIKALEDALKIIKDMDADPELNSNRIPETKALKELLN